MLADLLVAESLVRAMATSVQPIKIQRMRRPVILGVHSLQHRPVLAGQ
jgi:hypothetical protein